MAGDGVRQSLESIKPVLAMVATQLSYATMAVLAKRAFSLGMAPVLFVFYRQAIGTLALAPVSLLSTGRSWRQLTLGFNGFCLVFLAAFMGGCLCQYFYNEGLALTSPSAGLAIFNLVPAITFLIVFALGMEKVRSLRSMAKVFGTAVSVAGALCLALFKGPVLLLPPINTGEKERWVIGVLYLSGNAAFWSIWLTLQVPIFKHHTDPLSFSTWMCFLSSLQSAVFVFFTRPRSLDSWKITSWTELIAVSFSGIVVSGVTFYLTSWCITVRGPLFSAMFNPLGAVIAAVFSVVILHEDLYVGSLIGAAAVILGLYMVLWGKAGDQKQEVQEGDCSSVAIAVDGGEDGGGGGRGGDESKEPLLAGSCSRSQC